MIAFLAVVMALAADEMKDQGNKDWAGGLVFLCIMLCIVGLFTELEQLFGKKDK